MVCFLKNKFGLSPVIAVILILGIVVAATVIVYLWASSFQSRAQEGVAESRKELRIKEKAVIVIDKVLVYVSSPDPANWVVYVYVRNGGSTRLNNITVFIECNAIVVEKEGLEAVWVNGEAGNIRWNTNYLDIREAGWVSIGLWEFGWGNVPDPGDVLTATATSAEGATFSYSIVLPGG